MNYQQTLDYLYNSLPMFSRIGSAAIKKDLTNTVALCKLLHDPHKKFKSIHVGGTNGKGSVSHMLAAIFQTAGYKTGLYTSPHLYDFRERIKINGAMIKEDFVVDFVDQLQSSIKKIQPSFFEITVAMAFEYFAQQKVDVAIVEVGLGGRLDSTNVITPELSIITNIGWDHMNMLGNSLEEIAFEKAGIIKKSVPVVIGEKTKETEEVFIKQAAEKQTAVSFAEEQFFVSKYQLSANLLSVSVNNRKTNKTTKYELDLPGLYQTKNILTVLQSVELLKDWRFSEHQVQAALKKVKQLTGLHGRWEIIHKKPSVVLEVAHNKNGMEQMLLHLYKINFNKLHFIMGMVKDKDIEAVLELLPVTAQYYFTQATIPRALDAATLKEKASAFHLKGNVFENVNIALQQALIHASPDDLIVICGSIFLVAEVNIN